MLTHDTLDGLGGLVSVVEGDGGDVVVEDVSLNDTVKKLATNETEFAVDSCSGTSGESPGVCVVVGKGGISVLEESDGDCAIIS